MHKLIYLHTLCTNYMNRQWFGMMPCNMLRIHQLDVCLFGLPTAWQQKASSTHDWRGRSLPSHSLQGCITCQECVYSRAHAVQSALLHSGLVCTSTRWYCHVRLCVHEGRTTTGEEGAMFVSPQQFDNL